MANINQTDRSLLEAVADLHQVPEGAYNIRNHGQGLARHSTANIDIVQKTDKPGIDIRVKPGTQHESIHIPVILTESGLSDMVYNDFYIGEGADVLIIAGCGIHNCGDQRSQHDGIHSFHLARGARIRYVEKHYGEGNGSGERILNPRTIIEMEENTLSMVAIDGFRMAIAREQMKNKKRENIIIPAKILSEVSRIITESEFDSEDVNVLLSKKNAVFNMENTKVVIRLLEGEFMNYKRIIPAENPTKVILNRSDFLESVERASLLAKVGKNNLIKLDIKDGNIEITSKSEEGNVKEEVIATKEGNDLVIGFNSKYMIDALKVIDDESITMFFNTSVSPCLVKPVTGDSFEYLILPVRISQ